MATSEADVAAKLIERLLADPAFRAEFRRDPATACRKAGLDELAEEMSIGAGKAMITLDQRESKSSLAGVMMAAAMEGVSVYQFGEHVLPHLDDVPSAVGDVLSRVSLPALPGRGALSGGADAPEVAPAPPNGATGAAEAGAPGGAGGAAVAAQDAVAEIKADAEDLPAADDVPDSGVAPKPVEEAGKGAGDPAPRAAASAAAPQAPEPQGQVAAPVDQAPGDGSQRIDPTQFGGEGGGGAASAETLALLENKNITFDDTGVSDLKAGRIDPRVVAVLTKLSHDHKLSISCMCSDHPKLTTGGSVSNHFHGRGVDIASVDGEIVNPGSLAARELATEMQEIDAQYRPDEIGSPWAISGPGYFTDAGHQDHVHLGFKTEIDPNWTPPPDVASGTPAPAPAAAAVAAPGPPAAAAAAPPEPKGHSMSFRAVTADDAAKTTPKKGDSLAFMAVRPPVGPATALAEPGTVPAAVADAATAKASGSSSLGASALEVAKGELARGVHEEGVNTGTDVDKYLAEAGVSPGNPWCASFVTWSLARAGHKMDGGGWAAVQTWVRNAEAGKNDLQVVSAADARPGDIVAYDWGGQEDFGSDGHIGFLASNVQGGKFTALEGNNDDAVMSVPRQTGDANVKFIRIGGGAPPAATAPPAAPNASGALPPSGNGAAQAAADAVAPAGGGAAGAKALAAIAEAKKYMGTAYRWGGSTPDTGFDCSGLVQWAYAKAGIELPRITYDQINVGKDVPIAQLTAGDLVFFGKPKPWHVGMALGDGKFLHAPKTGDVVKVSDLDSYWKGEFTGARRVDGSAAVAAAAAPAAPAVDPAAVAKAQAAVARDAAEVKKGDTMLFMAVKAHEADRQHRVTVQFMKAVDPEQQVKARAAAAAAPATGPTAGEDAAMNQAVGAPVPAGELALQQVGQIGMYPGDQASQAELAKWLASEAEKAGLPPELPVMASLVESGVKNLRGGDADSAGFFQMRVGIWDQGPYKGYRTNPQLQAKWFIDNALAVRRQRLAAGKSVTDPGAFGDWIADIERPAAQFRYRYQLQLTQARRLLA